MTEPTSIPASPASLRPQPLITVHDVEASGRWYETLLGLPSGHGGPEYERIGHGDDFVLQLHAWHAHEEQPGHEHLGDEHDASRGNGVVLWFRLDDFDGACARAGGLRAGGLRAEILDGPLVNPNARHRELWLRDPDGYVLVIAGAPGDLGPSS